MKTSDRYGTTLRIYDKPGTMDRFTIIPPRNARSYYDRGADSWAAPGFWSCIGTSECGNVSGLSSATPGAHLGKRIHWRDLPPVPRRMCYSYLAAFVPELETVARHMCIAAVWADAEEGTRPRLTHSAMDTARRFAVAFIEAHAEMFAEAMDAPGYGAHPDAGSVAAAFGHDLYLTARGHGVGFWSRDELAENDLGDRLSAPLRDNFRRWWIEAEQYRGNFYLSAPNVDKPEA